MNYKISISPSGIEFLVKYEQNILDAAIAANVNLPHQCKDGNCSSCLCKIVSGKVKLQPYSKTALTDEALANGYALTCRAQPESDIVLDIPGFNNSFPIKTLPAKIEKIDKSGSVAILQLKLPTTQEFRFEAGQYVDILHEGKKRSYSIANSPLKTGIIELHIRYRQGGFFSDIVWNKLKINQFLRLKGPMGNFALHNESSLPMLLVCTGTGFAPLKAIIEQMLATENTRQITLIWGNYLPDDFYLTDLFPEWQKKLNLKIQLCTDSQTDNKTYFTGMVTDYILSNKPDLAGYELYACGNPDMIASLNKLSTDKLGLNKMRFYSDVFTTSK